MNARLQLVGLVLAALIALAYAQEPLVDDDAAELEKRSAMRNAMVRFGRSAGMRNALVRFGKRGVYDYLAAKRAQTAPEPFVRFGRSASPKFAAFDYNADI